MYYYVEYGNRTKNNETLLSNFDNSELKKIKKAIKIYKKKGGKAKLYINKKAYWRDGTLDKKLFGLHIKSRCDLSDFWRIVDKLEKDKV